VRMQMQCASCSTRSTQPSANYTPPPHLKNSCRTPPHPPPARVTHMCVAPPPPPPSVAMLILY
jgi:hypothetical protein